MSRFSGAPPKVPTFIDGVGSMRFALSKEISNIMDLDYSFYRVLLKSVFRNFFRSSPWKRSLVTRRSVQN
jgi:hypothetical protein